MQPEQPAEPTLADVLRAVNDLATYTAGQFTRVDVRLGQLDAAIGTVRAEVGSVSAKVDQVRADIAAVKVDITFTEAHIGDLQNAVRRHLADPNPHAA